MTRPSHPLQEESPFTVARPFPARLAPEIGWERIAGVVDAFYDQVTLHPSLRRPFSVVEDWPRHKERLTYFWWIVLGGEKFRREMYEPVPKHFRAGFNEILLSDWLALFEQTVRQVVPDALADAWVERARQVGASLVIANKGLAERMS